MKEWRANGKDYKGKARIHKATSYVQGFGNWDKVLDIYEEQEEESPAIKYGVRQTRSRSHTAEGNREVHCYVTATRPPIYAFLAPDRFPSTCRSCSDSDEEEEAREEAEEEGEEGAAGRADSAVASK